MTFLRNAHATSAVIIVAAQLCVSSRRKFVVFFSLLTTRENVPARSHPEISSGEWAWIILWKRLTVVALRIRLFPPRVRFDRAYGDAKVPSWRLVTSHKVWINIGVNVSTSSTVVISSVTIITLDGHAWLRLLTFIQLICERLVPRWILNPRKEIDSSLRSYTKSSKW